MTSIGFLNLKGIRGQITALVAISIVALHAIITATFLIYRAEQPEQENEAGPFQLTTAVRILGRAPTDERPRLIADIARAYPEFQLAPYAGPVPADAGRLREPPGADARPVPPDIAEGRPHGPGGFRGLGPGFRVFMPPPGSPVRHVIFALPDGEMVSARMTDRPHRPPFWGAPWLTTIMFALISTTLLGLWAARALTSPLSSFAKAAENFSLDGDAPALPERGPEEIRSLARALNRMRQRITALMNDRTKMLAAISHDLRTPLTRMRLRCEFVDDELQRSRMLADLDQMHAMLGSVLSFLRNGRKLEPMTLVDIASILQLVADQFADVGHNVGYVGPAHAMATVRPDDMMRSVTNLVENAVKYGTETIIRLTIQGQGLVIDVEDNGPGISDARKPDMLEPFVRGDDARNMDEATGFGLGLSIAKAIVQAHGGELSLHDRKPNGLIARIELPLSKSHLRPAA
ncbi:putative two component sensor histidine kinase; osmolarity sensor [Bradyrhizobium sp. ORS 285]|uniref:ATP-binding protein n=1 Tax=Bradyrhizobium sp. ORS 285 TaxID=115808 RepID=UPI00024094E4|nr:ATP-binding protein [Bradyrhizobium sp. ORS 285]CCD86910.1 putative two component sensor histidine kinase; osmolarity sensor [Bradyrhizobium sp. ORS 285]SMX60462.1 putative two component sensor histidine kinase; osmolarity sensor [Bradyrhizobium sp. ORS 285]